ncbi:DUF4326 domain-containing protein [Streptomyces sp. NPDC050504]|uniref:DUF4326 domain-containing protein n=1 Tax=Streptomyces sp. NPDC050504 TaxID=3365618 RepID=UPI0037BA50EE
MNPTRIQRRRTKGWTAPEGAVYVGRPTRWANPFTVRPVSTGWQLIDLGDRSRSLREAPQIFAPTDRLYARLMATRLFELHHTTELGIYRYNAAALATLRADLAGRDLMCWCPLPGDGEPDHCHAAVLLALANEPQS